MVKVHIVVDPAIVMIPANNANRTEVELWVNCLDTWLTEALTAPFMWLHFLQATKLLEAHGYYPGFQQLRDLQRKYQLDINSSQIARSVHEFFRDEALDLVNLLNKTAFVIEAENGSIRIKPESFVARLPEYIHNDLYNLWADCCVCKHLAEPPGQDLYIATSPLNNNISKELVVSVVVLDAEPNFVRPHDNKIEQTFPLLITPDDLRPLTHPLEMWIKGEPAIVYAIKQQYKKDWSSNVDTPLPFQLVHSQER